MSRHSLEVEVTQMARKFKTVDYEEALEMEVKIGDVLPPGHLARFVVFVIAHLDLSAIYQQYAPTGGPPYAPEILLGLLFYGYATGVFSSRKIEKGTYETIPFRFIAGGWHPDHDTIANFRKEFLPDIQELFVQILVVAKLMGMLKLGHISLDGTKIHADASKHNAVSYKRLLALESKLLVEVQELFALAEKADSEVVPEGMVIEDEMALRQSRMAQLEQAKAVLEARAELRYEAEKAEYEARMREREAKEQARGRKFGGPKPKPPVPGPRDKDQYNFTDPQSPIMKNSNNQGFDQHYNAQTAVDQDSILIVGYGLSDHVNDKQEAVPTLEAIPTEQIGWPDAAAMDNGYFSQDNIEAFESRGVEPYIATGRQSHHQSWQERFAHQPDPPPAEATAKEKMAYKLKTEIGQAIYRLRKSTVEPVIGIIKEVLGFRQFSLRGLVAAAGEWGLVCIGFNLKRMHTLYYS
jgi:transposase